MMRSGTVSPLPPLVRLTDGIGSGYWPTATTNLRPNESMVRMYRAAVLEGRMTEEEATALLWKSPWEAHGKIPAMWATPQARDYRTGQAKRWDNPDRSRNLNDQAAKVSEQEMFPTPRAQDSYERSNWKTIVKANDGEAQMTLTLKVKYEAGKGNGQLNPRWVEWLMGYPGGWTDLSN